MITTKDPAVAVAENLWEALRSGFLGTEKTIVEIIKARAWEPLGYETFTDAWVKEVADISIANEAAATRRLPDVRRGADRRRGGRDSEGYRGGSCRIP